MVTPAKYNIRNWNWTESVSSEEKSIDLKFSWRSWGKKRCLKQALRLEILYSLRLGARVTHDPLKIQRTEALPAHKLENSLQQEKTTTDNQLCDMNA